MDGERIEQAIMDLCLEHGQGKTLSLGGCAPAEMRGVIRLGLPGKTLPGSG